MSVLFVTKSLERDSRLLATRTRWWNGVMACKQVAKELIEPSARQIWITSCKLKPSSPTFPKDNLRIKKIWTRRLILFRNRRFWWRFCARACCKYRRWSAIINWIRCIAILPHWLWRRRWILRQSFRILLPPSNNACPIFTTVCIRRKAPNNRFSSNFWPRIESCRPWMSLSNFRHKILFLLHGLGWNWMWRCRQRMQSELRINCMVSSVWWKRRSGRLSLIQWYRCNCWPSLNLPQSCLIDPGQFRALSDLVVQESRGSGKVDVISFNETND